MPKEATTREEMVIMVNRLLNRTPVKKNKSTYVDIDSYYWAADEIEAATEYLGN